MEALTEFDKELQDDLDEICSELEEENINKFDKCFVVKDEQHPLLLQMYSRKRCKNRNDVDTRCYQ